jgi:hypothetical protein
MLLFGQEVLVENLIILTLQDALSISLPVAHKIVGDEVYIFFHGHFVLLITVGNKKNQWKF